MRPVSSANGMKSAGDEAALRMTPTHQRLCRGDTTGAGIHERLVVQLEFLNGDGAPQIGLQPAPGLHTRIERGLEPAERALAIRFGLVEREVCVAQKLVRFNAVNRCERCADRGADVDELAIDQKWTAYEFDDAQGQRVCRFRTGDIDLQDGELVAAETCDDVVLAQRRLETLGCFSKQHVAEAVSERVVHQLEPVEVEHEDREGAAVLSIRRGVKRDQILEMGTVWQTGQRVGEGERAYPGLGLQTLR